MEARVRDILGANPLSTGECLFLVWAPYADSVKLRIVEPPGRSIPMERLPKGYFRVLVEGRSSWRYLYELGGAGGKVRPDPASRAQAEGVHGPSQVVTADGFAWSDSRWRGKPIRDLILYEIHVGTFTPEGTFDAIIPRLRELRDLGVTAIELMPVAQFPGERNWGYDGVFPYCVQNSYGGPSGLKRLVNACHEEDLCVALDVVYNHLGPEGNYLADFGPYFTDRYRTPWGQAINFDGEYSDEVRRFFIENALYWIRDFHVDALRLDAVHAIVDTSARPFLGELNQAVQAAAAELQREVHVIAECDRNDIRTVLPPERGGYGFAAQWNDDFHHAVHAVLTGESSGYYEDFGKVSQIAGALTGGYVYQGEYSRYRLRSQGSESKGVSGEHFVVFTQNHDQVGNRMNGERLTQLVNFEALKVAAGVMQVSPFVPLLFMGEEYGETAPFQYFVSHQDGDLIEAVRRGRKNEFKAFRWGEEPPDPQDEGTFLRSRLNWELRKTAKHKELRDFYRQLLRVRKQIGALASGEMSQAEAQAFEEEKALVLRRWADGQQVLACFNFGGNTAHVTLGGQDPDCGGRARPQIKAAGPPLRTRGGAPVKPALWERSWRKVLNSRDERWGGPGSSLPECLASGSSQSLTIEPCCFILYSSDERGTT